MLKKLMYLIPNIVLILYLIFYVPLLNRIIVQEAIAIDLTGAIPMNNTMNKISFIVLIITIILKIIFNAKRCEISKKESVINVIVFIVLILLLFFLQAVTAFA